MLSGLFLHLVRKPRSRALFASGGINLQPGDVPLACTLTRFPNLVSACVHDASVKASTVLTGSELGGYGNDPNFNRCEEGPASGCSTCVTGRPSAPCGHLLRLVAS